MEEQSNNQQTPMQDNVRMAPEQVTTAAPVESQDPLAPVMPVPTQPAPPMPKPKMQMSSVIIAILSGIIVIGIIAFIMMQYSNSKQTTQVAVPTPTVAPTPTPVLHLSLVATTSAFMTFADHIASLSAQVNGFSLQDGALNPPSLDAEITFKAQ